jgi:hypothetical protein
MPSGATWKACFCRRHSGMKDRFTHASRIGRGKIPKEMRQRIFERDGYTCQFCDRVFVAEDLTIDHLVPISKGGLDEPTNYVTCCRPCNEAKAASPLVEFSQRINVRLEELPVHGDPIIDNVDLPIQIRLLRKRIFERIRAGALSVTGKSAQKKLEKTYRTSFWETPLGRALELEFPLLPGQCRIMIPEIRTIAKDSEEFLLLVELAKSANTRNLVGTVLRKDCDIVARTRDLAQRPNTDPALKKRLLHALDRFEGELRRRSRTEAGFEHN